MYYAQKYPRYGQLAHGASIAYGILTEGPVFSSKGGFERAVSFQWRKSSTQKVDVKNFTQLITNIPNIKMSDAELFYDPGVLAMALYDLLSAHEMGQLKWTTSGYM